MTSSLSPYPILGRGHSGGRMVCEAFIRNGIDMGKVSDVQKDTTFFSFTNPQVKALISQAYEYLQAEDKTSYQNDLQQCIEHYHQKEIQADQPFGWKMGVSLFLLPMVLETFPQAKVIHLIRDGRDIMLSRLPVRVAHLYDPVNRLTVFGRSDVAQYNDQPLNAETIRKYRNEFEMHHWVTAVSYGLYGRRYPERYLEVRYEMICQDPETEFQRIFDFLELPFKDSCRVWLKANVHQARIGKWKHLPEQDLRSALKIGEELLTKLGYI